MKVEVEVVGKLCSPDCPYLDLEVEHINGTMLELEHNHIRCKNIQMCRYIGRTAFEKVRQNYEQRKPEADNLHGQKP